MIDTNGIYTMPATAVGVLMKKYLNADRNFIADMVLPKVVVGATVGAGKIAIKIWDSNDGVWFDGKRARKAPISETEGGTYSIIEVDLEETSGKITTDIRDWNRELQAAASETALHSTKFTEIMNQIALKLEIEANTLIMTAANYNSAQVNVKTDTRWDTAAGYPVKDIGTMIKNAPIKPNTIAMSEGAWFAIANNPNVAAIMGVNQDRVIQPEWFSGIFAKSGITNIQIGTAVTKNADGTISDVWNDSVALLRVDSNKDMEAFGRNYSTTSTFNMTRTLLEHDTLWSHAGRFENVYKVVSKRAGNLITGVLTP